MHFLMLAEPFFYLVEHLLLPLQLVAPQHQGRGLAPVGVLQHQAH